LILAMNPWSQNNNNQNIIPACFVLLPTNGVTIPAGKNAVFTQTCQINFDTSEMPSPPAPTKNDKVLSVVHVSFGTAAATVDFVDLPQILNTGGIDPAGCTGANESHNWVNITNNNNLPF
jgi:hypothetical protein